MKNYVLVFCLFLAVVVPSFAKDRYQPIFSTAGFYSLPNTGREVCSMNPAWRFHRGDVEGAEKRDYDDRSWDVVSLPHGIENLPSEASGCVNYQGKIWYRKHFTPDSSWSGKRVQLHFEAIMGISRVWVNGNLMTEHLGGFLPVIIEVGEHLRFGEDNVIAVMADNSDNPSYPPGKAQNELDFTYAGGIYRDCWIVTTNNVFITDANEEDKQAGGGIFVSYDQVSEASCFIRIDAQLRNVASAAFGGVLEYTLLDRQDQPVLTAKERVAVGRNTARSFTTKCRLLHPHLWTPDFPYLYRLRIKLYDRRGKVVDGYDQRIGIRSIEFKGKDGFWLNGRPYQEPLIGANRHQDFAVVGNALPNSLHWRDAKKLRDAGLRVIRNAHYPQDPAFMDACDELGLLVIVNTPGWQFWNEDSGFANCVYSDIRNMVRRDRNHPSVWLWEPILNETSYPADFAKNVYDIVHQEYPYPYCYAACDAAARGSELFSVLFAHPQTGDADYAVKAPDPDIAYFTREWGDNVDDWNSHNSPSRASRAWGEYPMLVQAQGYARTNYDFTCYDSFYRTGRQHVGGCLWHSFDHQRGYHPDPFYGGIMDNYRQPKYAWYMFAAQRPPRKNENLPAESGPMIFIANAMTPFSPSDVTVYSNCEEVRLRYCENGKTWVYHKEATAVGMPSPVITFKDVFHVMDDKALARQNKQVESYLLAEGLMDGKVVVTHKVMPARRPAMLRLRIDDEGVDLHADGSDIVTVVAEVTDSSGHVKRLNNEQVLFAVEGPGRLLADAQSFTNPRQIQWGTAPVLVQATTTPGVIKVKASVVWQGEAVPLQGEIEIASVASLHRLIFSKEELQAQRPYVNPIVLHHSESRRTAPANLKAVARQQAAFEDMKAE